MRRLDKHCGSYMACYVKNREQTSDSPARARPVKTEIDRQEAHRNYAPVIFLQQFFAPGRAETADVVNAHPMPVEVGHHCQVALGGKGVADALHTTTMQTFTWGKTRRVSERGEACSPPACILEIDSCLLPQLASVSPKTS